MTSFFDAVSLIATALVAGIAVSAGAYFVVGSVPAWEGASTPAPATREALAPRPGTTVLMTTGPLGVDLRWGSCGGVVVIDTDNIPAHAQPAVIDAAYHFTSFAAGPWEVVLGDANAGEFAKTITVTQVETVPGPETTIGRAKTTTRGRNITASQVVLEADELRYPARWRELTLHEVAHAVGLDHVEDRDATMRPYLNEGLHETYTVAEADAIRRSTAAHC